MYNKYKTLKTIIFSIIMLFSFLLTFTVTVTLANNAIYADTDNQVGVSAVINLGNYTSIPLTEYNSNTEFDITNYAGLTMFGNMCSERMGFEGKKIYLRNDIDCDGQFLSFGVFEQFYNISYDREFAGTFYGGNYTISNFVLASSGKTLVSYNVSGAGGGYGSGVACAGLFQHVTSKALIRDLKLKDFKTSINNWTGGSSSGGGNTSYVVAGLVGYAENGARIQNCSIENFQHISKTSTGSGYVYSGYVNGLSGIIAAGYGEISNCYVDKISSTYTGDASMPITGVGPAVTKVTATANSFTTFKSSISYCISKGQAVSVLSSTSSYSSANSTSGLSCSSSSGSSGSTWYYSSGYNGGYPYLRQFITWKTISFSVSPSGGGSVSPSSIQIPNDASFTPSVSGSVITILGQAASATPSSSYEFTGWTASTYTANFKLKTYTLNFNNATGTSGDTISPNGTGYTVSHGTSISVSHTSGNGPLTLSYTFKNSSGTNCSVTYSIPAKYKLVNANNPGSITGVTTIAPTVEFRTFTVTLKSATGSNKTSDTTWTVKYGESVSSNTENLSFAYGGETMTYTANSGYKFDSITITKDGEMSNVNALSSITGNIVIQPTFARWYTITFTKIGNTTTPTTNQIMKVKSGDSITATYTNNQKMLTYEYNGTSVTYEAAQYYIVNKDSTTLTGINSDKTITPTTEFYACTVTITKSDPNSIATLKVGEEEKNVYELVVEFGTVVKFTASQSESKFTYTYTFTFEGATIATIKFIINNDDYAMASDLNSGQREWHTELGASKKENEYEFKESAGTTYLISPTFELKQYAGNLA